jgi:hypothetical protein
MVRLGAVEIVEALKKFLPHNRGTLISPRVLVNAGYETRQMCLLETGG